MYRLTTIAVAVLLCLGAANGEDAAPPPKNSRPVPKNVTLDDKDKPSTMLSSNTTGVGASCVPTSSDFFGPGSGCTDTEACCPTTNMCLDRSGGCAAFAKRCPPPDCGRSLDFSDTECPADVTKLFKKGGVKCQASADTMCFSNSTSLALKCSVSAGVAAAPQLLTTIVVAALGFMMAMH